MLSRIANNLFWMGRYLERIEHTIRYTKVNYFSSMDAPNTVSKRVVLDSILRMNGVPFSEAGYSEQDVLQMTTFDRDNASSIVSSIYLARENARGARDVISTELWEAINKYYHFVINFDQEAYRTTKLFEFSQNSIEQITSIKGQIDGTLVHNEVWSIIKLGLYLERADQILRAVKNKWQDMETLNAFEKENTPILSHQTAALLQGLASFDMSRKHYRSAVNVKNALEFVLLNDKFPRSLQSSLRKVAEHISDISESKGIVKESAEFIANKSYTKLKYGTIEEVMGDLPGFIAERENFNFTVGSKLMTQYFSF